MGNSPPSRRSARARPSRGHDQDHLFGLFWLLRNGGGLRCASEPVGRGTRGSRSAGPSDVSHPATRASATSIFQVDHPRQIVHSRPVETVHCHPVTDRTSRPTSDSHLPRIEADMCIGGEYRLALILLWLNGFPGCDVSCCPVRRSAGRRGGTTSAASRVVRASTTPSTVTPPAAGMALASPSSSPTDSANSPTPPDSDRSDSTTYVTGRPAPNRPGETGESGIDAGHGVGRPGIEPGTRGLKVRCSTC